MVAKITTPHSIHAALNYNENKVNKGKATCLHAANYLRDPNDMNFYQKLQGFERLNELNERASTKTLHISLNFDPSEKLSDEKLKEIASVYMDKIGFSEQPFLVYKHSDAGHPHIHIVTTTIRHDGSRINTHNIGRNQSEKARKEIEKDFALVRAEDQKQMMKQPIRPVDNEKIIYGKTETKKSITNVVNAVLHVYKYTSLPEFNAILKQYNVTADRGKEDGRIFKHRGLIYRILDADGNKIGVPIKASSINSKPTLDKLEKIFLQNEPKKEPFKQSLKSMIDDAFAKQPKSLKELLELLQQKNVYTVLRQSTEGKIYGITFVDNQNKTVFNGSDIGKGYSAAHLQNRILAPDKKENLISQEPIKNTAPINQVSLAKSDPSITDILFSQEQTQNTPFELRKKKKKKRKNATDSKTLK